mmetsp:Transcript_8618/g.18837  ORF Transcript_8618/g.18837 Transcript_8618/m.18837 type:complete len:102 (-) Transcript_8618:1041-1346(-)
MLRFSAWTELPVALAFGRTRIAMRTGHYRVSSGIGVEVVPRISRVAPQLRHPTHVLVAIRPGMNPREKQVSLGDTFLQGFDEVLPIRSRNPARIYDMPELF